MENYKNHSAKDGIPDDSIYPFDTVKDAPFLSSTEFENLCKNFTERAKNLDCAWGSMRVECCNYDGTIFLKITRPLDTDPTNLVEDCHSSNCDDDNEEEAKGNAMQCLEEDDDEVLVKPYLLISKGSKSQ